MEETIDEVDRLRDKLSRTEAERYNPDHTSVFGASWSSLPSCTLSVAFSAWTIMHRLFGGEGGSSYLSISPSG